MVDVQAGLSSLLKELKLKKQLPKNMDVSRVGDRYWFVCHDYDHSNIVSEESATGFSESGDVALLKALSERAERLAFQSGFANGIKSCMTARSDGFAAYPLFYGDAEVKARDSAFHEAVERFVWATWWDDENIAFGIDDLTDFSKDKKVLDYARIAKAQFELEDILIIRPRIANAANTSVIILLGRLKSGGFISGGACGSANDAEQILLRSLDELYRHGLAVKKIKSSNIAPITLYEKRLAYFGLGQGTHLVTRRIEASGFKSIVLPSLEIDEPVNHELQDLFQVHRCHFENQPPFIGGAMERLCL